MDVARLLRQHMNESLWIKEIQDGDGKKAPIAMKIQPCLSCQYGTIRDGNSFCAVESCYSYLAKCIQRRALAAFLKTQTVELSAFSPSMGSRTKSGLGKRA